MPSPFAVMQGCADETNWDDNSQLAIALNFIYNRPELWNAFEQHCLTQVADESVTCMNCSELTSGKYCSLHCENQQNCKECEPDCKDCYP